MGGGVHDGTVGKHDPFYPGQEGIDTSHISEIAQPTPQEDIHAFPEGTNSQVLEMSSDDFRDLAGEEALRFLEATSTDGLREAAERIGKNEN